MSDAENTTEATPAVTPETTIVADGQGGFKAVPTSEAQAIEAARALPMALFEDETEGYSTTIRVGAATFQVLELLQPEVAEVKRANEIIAGRMGIAPGDFDTDAKRKAALAAIPDGPERFAAESLAYFREVLAKHVKGWTGAGRPFTPEALAQLRPSTVRTVFGELLQKSTLGASSSDFLAE